MPDIPKDKRTEHACAWVAAGDVDIAEIQNAVWDRLATGEASIGWVLDFDQLGLPGPQIGEVTASDLTLGEATWVSERCKVGWDRIDPLKSAPQALAVVAAVHVFRSDARGDDDKTAKAVERVENIPSAVFESAYRFVEKRPADPS